MMQQYSVLGVFLQGEMGYNIETQSDLENLLRGRKR